MKLGSISTDASHLENKHFFGIPLRIRSNVDLIFEAVRYLLASSVGLVVDFLVYIGLIRLFGVNYLVSAAVGFGLGLVTVYFLSVKLVFRERVLTNKLNEFLLFAGIGVVGLLLNAVILYVAVGKVHLTYEISKVISAGLIFFLNFTLRKLVLFNKKGK